MPFGTDLLEWLGYPMVKKFRRYLIRFDATHERDRHTDRRTDTAWQHRPRLCIARQKSFSNNFTALYWTRYRTIKWQYSDRIHFGGLKNQSVGNNFGKPQSIRTKFGTHTQVTGRQRSGNFGLDRTSGGVAKWGVQNMSYSWHSLNVSWFNIYLKRKLFTA